MAEPNLPTTFEREKEKLSRVCEITTEQHQQTPWKARYDFFSSDYFLALHIKNDGCDSEGHLHHPNPNKDRAPNFIVFLFIRLINTFLTRFFTHPCNCILCPAVNSLSIDRNRAHKTRYSKNTQVIKTQVADVWITVMYYSWCQLILYHTDNDITDQMTSV